MHDQGHACRQDEVGYGYRTARSRNDRREVAAAEAVHQVVNPGESGLLDDRCGGCEVPRRRARDQFPCDGIERGRRDIMKFGVQRRRWRPYRERAQHLAGVLWRGRCADLARDDVALPPG